MSGYAALAHKIGQDQGRQLWFTASPAMVNAGNVIINAPTRADLSRPSSGVEIVARYRATIGTAAYSAMNAEVPQNFIQSILLNGNRLRTGQTTIYQGSGATLFALNNMYDTSLSTGCRQYIKSSVAGSNQRMPRLSTPMGLTIGTAIQNFGGVASFDVETHYFIPFAPFGSSKALSTLFTARDSDWNRTMSMQIVVGSNLTAAADWIGTKGASGTLALTAYGSGSGSPLINVYLLPELQKGNGYDLTATYKAGVIQRVTQAPATALTANQNQNALIALLQNYDTPRIIFKSGVVTALGDYSSLDETILSQPNFTLANKPVTQFNDVQSFKSHYEDKGNGQFPQGYNSFDTIGSVEKQNYSAIFKAPPAAQQFQFISSVVGAANQQGEIIQEQVVEEPVTA